MKRMAAWLMSLVLTLSAGGCGDTNRELYERAQLYLGYGEYAMAEEMFRQLGEYHDSADYALYCAGIAALKQEDYALARANFDQVDPFKSSGRYLDYLDAAQLSASGDMQQALTLWESLGSFADSAHRADELRAAIPESRLAHCRALMAAGRYEQARGLLAELGDYGDSVSLLAECDQAIRQAAYRQAISLYDASRFDDAMAAFEALGDTLDARARVLLCRSALYRQAEASYQSVTLDTAAELMAQYRDLEQYLESATRLRELEARFGTNLALSSATLPHAVYGAYPTEESGAPGSLSWRVLCVQEGVATLLCDRVIDALPVASATDLSLTLTDAEQAGLQALALPDTEILSAYLPSEDWRCDATPYALAQGVRHSASGQASWWLRDTSADGQPIVCRYGGALSDTGVSADSRVIGVRPLVQVSLNDYAFTSGVGTAEEPFR